MAKVDGQATNVDLVAIMDLEDAFESKASEISGNRTEAKRDEQRFTPVDVFAAHGEIESKVVNDPDVNQETVEEGEVLRSPRSLCGAKQYGIRRE